MIYFQEIINILNKTKNQLLLGNIFLVFLAILFFNLGLLPFSGMGDFLFLAVLVLAGALYRPGWAFLLFIGMLPLETINLAPEILGIAVRPYQLLGASIIIAILTRAISGKSNFSLIRPDWKDAVLFLVTIGGFLSLVNAPEKISGFKLAIVLSSFFALYFLARNYLQEKEDFKKVLPFFLSSAFVIIIYGIWQNWRFIHNLPSFEVMPGRPNSTFSEADWLGGYMVLVISIIYSIIYYLWGRAANFSKKLKVPASPAGGQNSIPSGRDKIAIQNSKLFTIYHLLFTFLLLASCFLLLILTVSRSAWLGAFAATFIFLFAGWTNLKFDYRIWQWKKTLQIKLFILSAFLIALGSVFVFHLTDFQLWNRAQSTGTGLQKITIACKPYDWVCELPDQINDVSELDRCACKHINLENIESEKAAGNSIREVYRRDPNVDIRAQIYQKSWTEIKKHPISGIGWGSIGKILGTDERGTGLNSSNIFLEIWLGSGILGLLAFLAFLGYFFWRAILVFYLEEEVDLKAIGLFMLTSGAGLIVFNLFNAGIFLAFFWIWMGIHGITRKLRNDTE